MKGRKKNQKKSSIESFFSLPKNKTRKIKILSNSKRRSDFRFSTSLVMMIAILSTSVLLLLISLVGGQLARAESATRLANRAKKNTSLKKPKAGQSVLNIGYLDFKVTIPSDWTGWVYRTGKVKSPTDDSIADEYLKVYLPDSSKVDSSNFDDKYKEIFSIVKYDSSEWEKIEKSCASGKADYCRDVGVKLGGDSDEGSDFVYALSKTADCSPILEAKCREVDKITESFELK